MKNVAKLPRNNFICTLPREMQIAFRPLFDLKWRQLRVNLLQQQKINGNRKKK